MEPIETETVPTPAGDYRIEYHYDESAEPPYNEGLGFVFDGGRDRIETGRDAGIVRAIIDDVNSRLSWRPDGVPVYPISTAALARYLRIRFGFIGIRIVGHGYYTTAPDSRDHDRIHGIAWAPDDALGPNGPDGYTDVAIAEYRAWANGDVFGYVVIDPSGDTIDSCWGFYGFEATRSYVHDEALSSISSDAAARGKKCALAGAGFVGII